MVLAGGVALPSSIEKILIPDAPITPELPAGYIDINGTLLKVHSLTVTHDTGIEPVFFGYEPEPQMQVIRPRETELELATFNEYPLPHKLMGKISTIHIRPHFEQEVVLSGQATLVEHIYNFPEDGFPYGEYRFISTNDWRWIWSDGT